VKSWFCKHRWQFPFTAKLVSTSDFTPVGHTASVVCLKCFKVKSKIFVEEAHATQWLTAMASNKENEK
jgi:hypothetical protein